MTDAAIHSSSHRAVVSHFGRLNETTFTGYARDLDRPDLALAIEIVLDGVPIALVRADELDENATSRCGGDGCCGFTFRARARDLLPHRFIEARVANSHESVGHPIDLALQPYEDGPRRAVGSVEWLGGLRLAGRLSRPADMALRPRIRVHHQGVLLVEKKLQLWSQRDADEDARSAIRFDLHMPLPLADGHAHMVEVTDGAGRALEGSPVWFQAFDDGLRRSLEESCDRSIDISRAAWFDRLLPMSLPFASYDEWCNRFDPTGSSSSTAPPVRVIAIGDGSVAPGQGWSGDQDASHLMVVRSADCLTFSWDDLRQAIEADETGCPVVVFADGRAKWREGALARLAHALAADSGAIAAYGDVEIDRPGGAPHPLFFGSFDYERLLEQGYAVRVFALRRDHVRIPSDETVGTLARLLLTLFDDGLDAASRILHVPGVLARVPEPGTADTEALAAAVRNHLSRRHVAAKVTPGEGSVLPAIRVLRLVDRTPTVSIVICFRNRTDHLRGCRRSLLAATKYPYYETIIVDNGSVSEDAQRYLEECHRDGSIIVRADGPYNVSRLNNRGVRMARGDYVCLLSSDTQIVDPHWLDELVSRMAESDVGVVAPLLLGTNRMVQHAGIVLGPGFSAVDAFTECSEDDCGYADFLKIAHESSAVTDACMLVRRTDFMALSGFDEVEFPAWFHDVDFCLRLRAAGRRIVVTPHAKLMRLEPTPQPEIHATRDARWRRGLARLRARWGTVIAADPAYSPFLNLDPYPFSALGWPPRSPSPRRALASALAKSA